MTLIKDVRNSTGGFYNEIVIKDCNFSNNLSKYTGAFYVFQYIKLSISGCQFNKNKARLYAGAV